MTIPYTTGTVSVTAGSAVVAGVGTAWLTGGIVGGEFGVDRADGNPIPILSVDSDTQITLAKPWRGATAAGQGYWIIRDTAYLRQVTDNAQKLATYIARLDNASLAAFAALAGTMAGDKLPYATGANTMDWAALTALGRSIIGAGAGVSAYGALGEIPNAQLPGRLKTAALIAADFDTLTETGWYRGGGSTPGNPFAVYGVLEHIQYDAANATQTFYRGGTLQGRAVRNKVAGAWQAWAMTTDKLLGVATQSGGVPTGAIIERGSNANGQYVRFADGTQFCFLSTSLSLLQAGSTPFYRGTATLTLPATFSTTSGAVVTCADDASPLLWGSGNLASTSTINLSLYYTTAIAGRTAVAMATGRWF